MPSFNFQKQFAAAVESGDKRQTIRAKRKVRPEIGQTAYLYTGMRTKSCLKLGQHTIISVVPIMLGSKGVCFWPGSNTENSVSDAWFLDQFAADDGFKNWNQMRDWFKKTHGLPFEGHLIKW